MLLIVITITTRNFELIGLFITELSPFKGGGHPWGLFRLIIYIGNFFFHIRLGKTSDMPNMKKEICYIIGCHGNGGHLGF